MQDTIFKTKKKLAKKKQPFQIEGEDPREDYKQVHFLSLEIQNEATAYEVVQDPSCIFKVLGNHPKKRMITHFFPMYLDISYFMCQYSLVFTFCIS